MTENQDFKIPDLRARRKMNKNATEKLISKMSTMAKELTPKVVAIDGDNKEVIKKNKHYIEAHKTLPENYQLLSNQELTQLGKELLNTKTSIRRKEKILLILAHNGNWKALRPLEMYVKNPDKGMRILAELAFEECRFWFDKDPYERNPEEQVYLGFEAKKPCPCGSKKLFKECHGKLPYGPPAEQPKCKLQVKKEKK